MKNYEPVIGLEVHIQLNTKSKMFSSTDNQVWQEPPNSRVSPVELGLPGALPVPNSEAIRYTQQLGYSLGCNLNKQSKFDRKNYFYPDLPKGYQISQYDQPFCSDGHLEIKLSGYRKTIRIRRIHLEEDTGKSMHKNGNTYLDFNKAGIPLVELVTEPDFSSAEEASVFAKMIQDAVLRLKISDADMEKGNMRLEANVSVREKGSHVLPDYRIELKNINSFRFMRNAINYEINRQIQELEQGNMIHQETRGWDEKRGISFLQRTKENAHDYRYFPEPDIPPYVFDEKYFEEVTKMLPVMPWVLEISLINEGISEEYSHQLAYQENKLRDFEELKSELGLTDINQLAKLVLNLKNRSDVLDYYRKPKNNATSDAITEEQIIEVISQFSEAIEDYKNGKEASLQFLVGQVIKKHKGQVNPQSLLDKIKILINTI